MARQANSKRSPGAPPLSALLALHFLPASLVFLVYIVAAGRLAARGIPPSLTLDLCFGIVGIPVIAGSLWLLGNLETQRPTLFAAVRFRERLRAWQYLVLVPGFLAYAVLVSALLAPLTSQLSALLATLVPTWFVEPTATGKTPAVAPWVLLGTRLAIDGVANPIAEELYFRGYLLPRLQTLGLGAPLVHGLLFALAHFWQPQNVPALAVIVIPLYYAVWHFRSVRLAIGVHCAANIVGAILSVAT